MKDHLDELFYYTLQHPDQISFISTFHQSRQTVVALVKNELAVWAKKGFS